MRSTPVDTRPGKLGLPPAGKKKNKETNLEKKLNSRNRVDSPLGDGAIDDDGGGGVSSSAAASYRRHHASFSFFGFVSFRRSPRRLRSFFSTSSMSKMAALFFSNPNGKLEKKSVRWPWIRFIDEIVVLIDDWSVSHRFFVFGFSVSAVVAKRAVQPQWTPRTTHPSSTSPSSKSDSIFFEYCAATPSCARCRDFIQRFDWLSWSRRPIRRFASVLRSMSPAFSIKWKQRNDSEAFPRQIYSTRFSVAIFF